MKKIPTLAVPNNFNGGRVFALSLLMGFFYALLYRIRGVSFLLVASAIIDLCGLFGDRIGNTSFLFPIIKKCYAKQHTEKSYHFSEAERDNNRTKLTRLRTLPGIFQKTQSNHGRQLSQRAHSRQGQNLYRSTSQFARAYPLQRNALPNGTGLINQTHRSTTKLHYCRVAPYCLIFKIS